MYIPHQHCERKGVMGHPYTCRRNSMIPCHLLYVIRYHDTIVLLCSTKILISDPRKLERELLTSMNMYFNDSGGENGGDICNIFDFDEDDDVVGRMQSEWDEDHQLQRRKGNAMPS